MDIDLFESNDLELDSLIQEMSIIDIDERHDIIKHLARYFPKPIEFLELIVLQRLLISGYIADLFRSSSSPIETSYVYYRALPSQYGNINTAIVDHFIRVQNAKRDLNGHLMVGECKIILIDYKTESDIQICERVVLYYLSIRSNPTIMTALGSHILSIQSSLQNIMNRRQTIPQDILDSNIWHNSKFVPYFQSPSTYTLGIVTRYDPILAYVRKNQ